jgi:hypothetical protein
MRRLGKRPSQISNTFSHAFTMLPHHSPPSSPPTSTFQLDFMVISLRLPPMRKLGSFLVILLLITAYGRCVADQFGVLHTTDSSCCQVTCSADSHCAEEATADAPHSEDSEASDDSTEEPAPCQLCFILSSDSILLGDSIDIPAPKVLELVPALFNSGLDNLLGKGIATLNLDQPPAEHPDPPEEHRSRLQRIVAKLTPARGPSIV